MLAAFYYSYWIAGHTSQKIKDPSYELLENIKDGASLSQIKSKMEDFRQKHNIPNKVQETLYGDDLYDERKITRLLEALEYTYSSDRKTILLNDKNTDIEHILPQNKNALDKHPYWSNRFSELEHQNLKNTLGNLTFLRDRPNRAVQQKPYPHKQKVLQGEDNYKKTSFDLTRELVETYDDWTPETIRDRRETIVKQSADLLNLNADRILQHEDNEE